MNNLDDWLNSIGIFPDDDVNSRLAPAAIPTAQEPVPENPPESTRTISADDFNQILADNGIQDAFFDQAEEIPVEEPAPVEENVYFHMPNGEVIEVPVQHESTYEKEVTEEEGPPAKPLLPANSPTLLMNDSVSRFSGAEWFKEIQSKRIIIAGQGGIGSNLSFQIARMAPDALYLYDDDIVETVNMSGQLFSIDDVSSYKVDAVTNMLHSYTTCSNIFGINERFTKESEPGDIMMCGFDNMEARRTFFVSWKQYVDSKSDEGKKNCLYLDGRLSLDTLQVFCITGDDEYNKKRYYQNYLFSDADADPTVCSMKQTTYLACMIASVMTNLFTNFCANLLNPVIPYDLPFFTEYDAQNMIFKTEK